MEINKKISRKIIHGEQIPKYKEIHVTSICYIDTLHMQCHLPADLTALLSQYSLLISKAKSINSATCVFEFFHNISLKLILYNYYDLVITQNSMKYNNQFALD